MSGCFDTLLGFPSLPLLFILAQWQYLNTLASAFQCNHEHVHMYSPLHGVSLLLGLCYCVVSTSILACYIGFSARGFVSLLLQVFVHFLFLCFCDSTPGNSGLYKACERTKMCTILVLWLATWIYLCIRAWTLYSCSTSLLHSHSVHFFFCASRTVASCDNSPLLSEHSLQ